MSKKRSTNPLRRIARQFTSLEKIVEREGLTGTELDAAHEQLMDERGKYALGSTALAAGVLATSPLKLGVTAPMAFAPAIAASIAVVRMAQSDERLPEEDRATVERAPSRIAKRNWQQALRPHRSRYTRLKPR
ncbi:MAG: hypothetical protein R3C52_04070 [Hyphomonadaceae bacterium]